jgi:hypothetical protein
VPAGAAAPGASGEASDPASPADDTKPIHPTS